MSNPADQSARTAFKYFNKFMVLMWRLGLYRWGMRNRYLGYIMVVTHTGRKTGRSRRTPVNFAIIDGDIYCVAGFGAIADWHRNLLVNPHVEVWLPEGRWVGRAMDLSDLPADQRIPLVRQVLINSGFAAYAAGVRPLSMSDAELADLTADYKLVRIERTAPRTGPGGPGDLDWVWIAATSILLFTLFSRRRIE